MYSFSTESDIENESQDYDISNNIDFFHIKEKIEIYQFEKAFNILFNNNENLYNFIPDLDEDYDNIIIKNDNQEKYNKDAISTQIFDNSENDKSNRNIDNDNNNNINNLLSKKHNRNNQKFKVNKINPKREIAFTTFNAKFNKYLTEKINKKITEKYEISKFYFTDENPLLSTKFTQCGIQKKLKEYLNKTIKEFIKKENMDKINKIGLGSDSLFNSKIYELIYDYYEYIYSNENELKKFLNDKKFIIRNEKFSNDGLINLNYEQDYKKIYGYLDFFKIDINLNKNQSNRKRFNISNKE